VTTDEFGHLRLGGIGALLAERIRVDMGCDARAVALGHPQRGGPPGAVDRIMGHLFGSAAAEACVARAFGQMVVSRGVTPACEIALAPMNEVLAQQSRVDLARHYDVDRYFVRRVVMQ
jgi:6-phosphofructokinase 1